jgi:aspartyl-tRNA(Asn)/glutamyl-tRNA(Gln) amidotransferase subunit B
MRTKVDSVDYKYFVEPNIPRIKLSQEWLYEIKDEIPMLPNERMDNYIKKLHLSEYDAKVLAREKSISDYFNDCVSLGMDPKTACNWITSQIMGYLNKENMNITDFFINPKRLYIITESVNKSLISSKQAKELFTKTLEEQDEPDIIMQKYGMMQMSDDNELSEIIDNILANSETQIEAYHNGRTNMFDYFVGQVMKETHGKANPVKVKEILNSKLN